MATSDNKPFVLSTGATPLLREALGEDLEKGAAIVGAGKVGNPMSLFMGVMAQVLTIDGKAVTYEDVLALPMMDVIALIGKMVGNGLEPSQLSAISSLSGGPVQ